MKHNITNLILSAEVNEKIANDRFDNEPTKANARKAMRTHKHLDKLYNKAYKQGVLSYAEVISLVSNIGTRKSSISRKAEKEYEEYLLTLDCMAEEAADTADGDGEF